MRKASLTEGSRGLKVSSTRLVLVQGGILLLDHALGEDLVLVLVLGEGAERTERGTHGNPH